MRNNIKTFLLMGILTFLLMLLGDIIGGRQGAIMGLLFAGIGNFTSYWFSDKMVLKAYKAKEIAKDSPIYNLVEKLCEKAKMPVPKVYIINQNQPNAFATGRNPQNASIAVTHGLLKLMDENEISGVIAHELAHVKNRDTLIGTIAATMAGAISFLAYQSRWMSMSRRGRSSNDSGGSMAIIGIILSLLAPIAASVVQMTISRNREYKADEFGAKFCGNPLYLRDALGKLGLYSKKMAIQGNPSYSHLFIINPFNSKKLGNLFSTHPPLEERMKRLEVMSQEIVEKSKYKSEYDIYNR